MDTALDRPQLQSNVSRQTGPNELSENSVELVSRSSTSGSQLIPSVLSDFDLNVWTVHVAVTVPVVQTSGSSIFQAS